MARFHFSVGPFAYRIDSKIPCVVQAVEKMYADYPKLSEADWTDFHVRVVPEGGLLKQLVKPQARLFLDNAEPFGVFRPPPPKCRTGGEDLQALRRGRHGYAL